MKPRFSILSKLLGKDKINNIDEMQQELDFNNIPSHIAFIMDGNGRWAKKRNLPRLAGHSAGVNPIKKILNLAGKLKIKYLTVYAFSTENWKRPEEEVSGLMRLLQKFLKQELAYLTKNKIKLNVLGDISKIPDYARHELELVLEKTKNNTGVQLNLALNYGGRDEILRAVKRVACELDGEAIKSLDEENFSRYLFTAGIPDPELLIRTSGEMRISNFLLWQIAYSEIWITRVLWPDFDEQEMLRAILAYQKRERRFGTVN
ncbi:MAG: isoprenyl transferase [bacterium]